MYKYSIILLCFLLACDSFFPRDPEEPTSKDSNFSRPDTPNILVNNLISSFVTKNTVNYLRCLQNDLNEDIFQFIATQDVSALNPSFFQDWDLKKEELVLINLFNSLNSGISPIITLNNRKLTLNPKTAIFEADYYIKVQHNNPDDSEIEYEGKLIFQMQATTEDYWYISTWQDVINEDSQFPTWTKLKLNFGK